MLGIPGGQKWKNQVSWKITNCYAQNFTNMFVRVVRTSVSIFRSIRPQKPILFDFHFFGYGNFTDHWIYTVILHWDLVRKKVQNFDTKMDLTFFIFKIWTCFWVHSNRHKKLHHIIQKNELKKLWHARGHWKCVIFFYEKKMVWKA